MEYFKDCLPCKKIRLDSYDKKVIFLENVHRSYAVVDVCPWILAAFGGP